MDDRRQRVSPSKDGGRDEYLRELRRSIKAKNRRQKNPSKGRARDAYDGGEEESGKQTQHLFLILCATLVATICTVVFSAILINHMLDTRASQREYAGLRDLTESTISAFDAEMRALNPDYVCWIKIEGTAIDYPVVRATDNERYLSVSFSGEENPLGALFMDYRCVGEYVPHIIIYGHNTKNGEMFGGLRNFLDEEYLEAHPIITLKVNDRIVEYEIFSARKTDVSDPAYYLDFSYPGSFSAFAQRCGAPADAGQILTLSTCVSGDNDDERVIVQGVLIAN